MPTQNNTIHQSLKLLAASMRGNYHFDGITSWIALGKNAFLEGSVEAIVIDQPIAIVLNQLKSTQPVTIPALQTEASIEMSFYLPEEELPFADDKKYIRDGFCRTCFNNTIGTRQLYPSEKKIRWMTLFIHQKVFSKMLPEMSPSTQKRFLVYINQAHNVSLNGTLPLSLHAILQDIWHNQNHGLIRVLKIKTLVYQLINEILKNVEMLIQEKPSSSFLRGDDVDKLYQARNYIRTHYDNPPTIKELARIVCLNEFKLKKGFKSVFNTTVRNYLIGKRMEVSKKMLQTADISVEQVALEVGYKCTSKFINTFKKCHGLTPGNYRKFIG